MLPDINQFQWAYLIISLVASIVYIVDRIALGRVRMKEGDKEKFLNLIIYGTKTFANLRNRFDRISERYRIKGLLLGFLLLLSPPFMALIASLFAGGITQTIYLNFPNIATLDYLLAISFLINSIVYFLLLALLSQIVEKEIIGTKETPPEKMYYYIGYAVFNMVVILVSLLMATIILLETFALWKPIDLPVREISCSLFVLSILIYGSGRNTWDIWKNYTYDGLLHRFYVDFWEDKLLVEIITKNGLRVKGRLLMYGKFYLVATEEEGGGNAAVIPHSELSSIIIPEDELLAPKEKQQPKVDSHINPTLATLFIVNKYFFTRKHSKKIMH